MDSALLTVIGILIGILLFGIKTGIGCGFSNITTREILTIGGSYFFLALLFGSVADRLSLDAFERLSSMGMGIHVLVSLLLIGVGIYTQKKWNAGKDVSRHTFLAISMPCPVCLGALAVSCTLLSGSLNLSGIKIGLLVGTAFLYQLWVSVSHSKLPNNDYFLQVQTLINQKTIETPREKMMGVLVILDNACQNRY